MHNTEPHNSRRLIEDWLPINEISIEAVRERAGAVPNPAPHQLHVWWARRPLAPSRAAVAASLLSVPPGSEQFYRILGTHPGIAEEQKRIDIAKATGVRLKEGYSQSRAFTKNLSREEVQWFQNNLVTSDPVVLDITAGGGSIPFEAGRLGFRTIANELNPVAGLILRATCEWPQRHGWKLLEHYQGASSRFLGKVRELTLGLYPKEPQPNLEKSSKVNEIKRQTQACLFARTLTCPSCEGTIPLSPNWRLDSKGTGIRLIPDTTSGTCSFEIVNQTADQSPGTVSRAKATCPYPNCGATTPAGYISQEAQAGRLGHQLYCIIYRDSWHTLTKAGRPSKRPKTARGFRVPAPEDDNIKKVETRLLELVESWDRDNILPTEEVPHGDDQRPHNYGMPHWRDMFSPRQLLAHGYCVQAFHELVDEDQTAGKLDEARKAAWCYIAAAVDKLINTNSLLCRWHANRQVVAGTFDSHDFGMKWSYAEMPIADQGWGLEWAVNDLNDCIRQLIQMTGHSKADTGNRKLMDMGEPTAHTAPPTEVTIGPAPRHRPAHRVRRRNRLRPSLP